MILEPQAYSGVEFVKPLIDDMVQDDPKKRPTIDEVVTRFAKIIKAQPWWRLRARVVELAKEKDPRVFEERNDLWFKWTIRWILRLKSALPRPS